MSYMTNYYDPDRLLSSSTSLRGMVDGSTQMSHIIYSLWLIPGRYHSHRFLSCFIVFFSF